MLLSLLNLYLHIHLEFWNHMVSCPFPFFKKKYLFIYLLWELGVLATRPPEKSLLPLSFPFSHERISLT